MSSSFTRTQYIEYIKLNLTGGLLELEISDDQIGKFVDMALIEIQRYIDEFKLVTVPFSSCIDLTNFDHSAITHVYRTQAVLGDGGSDITTGDTTPVDPMYAQSWMVYSNGGTQYNLSNYVYNYLAYNTLVQMRNTTSTDLEFKEDKLGNKLYINVAYDKPKMITIEYIPIFNNVEEVTSDYWIDILQRLSLGLVKVALGRIRTRFTHSNSPFQDDGQLMLTEGTTEVNDIRTTLRSNSNLFLPLD